MKTSEQTEKIAAALAKVQGQIKDASKSREGYGYRYADLAQVLQIVRPLLSENGIAVLQDAHATQDGLISVTTRLLHASGQWLETEPLAMKVEAKKGLSAAQCAGSVVTYARRYSLAALVGMTQEDDDASADRNSERREDIPVVSDEQLSVLRDLILATGTDETRMAEAFGVTSVDLLPAPSYDKAKRALEKKLAKQKEVA